MTTTEFHNALLQGRGSCVQAVQSDPELYREEVLWACRELTSFDTQCEGTRSWFVYTMIECYDDRTPFLRGAVQALEALPPDRDWHRYGALCALLGRFLEDGEQAALDALREKYRALYHALRYDGPPDEPVWHVRSNFHQVADEVAFCRDAFLEVARDIGRLFLETEWFDGWDFDWLYHSKGQRYRRALERAAERDEAIAAYIRVHEEAVREFEEQMRERKRTRLPRRGADPDEVGTAVTRYLNANTAAERADALGAFRFCPYPGDPSPVMADACAEDERLREVAWRVLENVRHPEVREFVLARVEAEEDAFGAFIANYEDRDEEILMAKLRAETVDFACTTWWHGYQLEVLELKKPPKAALQFIYDTTYCSCCRERAVRAMGRRRLLTDAMLDECRFDSYASIRNYARRALSRRKGRNAP